MAERERTFRILRSDPGAGTGPAFATFRLAAAPGLTVLEALRRIQAEQDGTLAFRSACRGAVCGSCAMVIDGSVNLACRVQVESLGGEAVVLEPLPHLKVLKDLVVDLDPFFAAVGAVRPWLEERLARGEGHVVPQERARAVEPYTNCILCASCHAVCPAAGRDPAYLGPAALAKAWRFLDDPRDGAGEERLRLVDSKAGVWGCDMVWNCQKVCPKGVPPTKGIGRMRARIKTGTTKDAEI